MGRDPFSRRTLDNKYATQVRQSKDARNAIVSAASLILMIGTAAAQPVFSFPDTVSGRKVLVFDFHTHSVFSDGTVWPTVRVEEALREGLDGFAVTEHLEYQPFSDFIPNEDRNAAFQIASDAAGEKLLIVNGLELTRGYPPGHLNALFLEDANKFVIEDINVRADFSTGNNAPRRNREVTYQLLEIAKQQNAFVVWNHPNWMGQQLSGEPDLTPMHLQLIADRVIEGIELNGSETNFAIALKYNLTLFANSDVHGPIAWRSGFFQDRYGATDPLGAQRRVTLVLAEDASEASVRRAIDERRTVALEDGSFFGRRRDVADLLLGGLIVRDAGRVQHVGRAASVYRISIENKFSSDLILENLGRQNFFFEHRVFTVPAQSQKTVLVTNAENLNDIGVLRFRVLNAYDQPQSSIELTVDIQPE